jgi:drug/metabolite transporter (DMT)-like permease
VIRAHLAVLGTNLFFAANFSLVKTISPHLIGPFALNVLRVGLSLVLFWTVWMFGKNDAGFRKKDLGRFLLCGLTGVAINQMLFIKGLTLTSTIHASLLMLVTPILVTVFALWVLKEKFTFFKAAGLALGIGGATLLILQKEPGHEASNYLLGDMLILLNAISYSIYFILVKPLMEHYSPLHVIRWVFSFGFLMILPFGWGETMQVNWHVLHWKHFAALAGIVVTGTFLAYYFNAYGIRHLGAGTTGSYIYTQPVFAVIIATYLLKETLSTEKILAGILIFLGVFLVSRNTRSRITRNFQK